MVSCVKYGVVGLGTVAVILISYKYPDSLFLSFFLHFSYLSYSHTSSTPTWCL